MKIDIEMNNIMIIINENDDIEWINENNINNNGEMVN